MHRLAVMTAQPHEHLTDAVLRPVRGHHAFEGCVEQLATAIAGKSLPALVAAKAALDGALETGLEAGVALEAEQFTALFDTADQKEGMAAFREKREPTFHHR